MTRAESSVLADRFGHSIRARLLFLVFVATVPVLAVTAYTTWALRSVQNEEIRVDLEYLARSASDQLKSAVESGEQLLRLLSQVPGVARGEVAECKRAFGDILGKSRRYTAFLVADAKGRVLCHSGGSAEPVDLVDRGYFQRARSSKLFSAGDLIVGRLTGRPVMNLAYPLLDGAGDFRGLITTGLDLQWFGERFDHARPDLELTFSILDAEATVLYRYPDHEKWVGKRVAETGIGQAVLSRPGESLIVEATGLTGLPMLYAIRRSEGWSATRFNIVVGVAAAQLHPKAGKAFFYSLTAFVLVFAAGLLATLLNAERSIRRPLAALSAASMRLTQGDLGARTGLAAGADELGQLAAAFDVMAGALQAEHQRIVESSASLARANRALRVLSDGNSALVRARDEAVLLQDMCDIAVNSGGYRTALVGYAEHDAAKQIRFVAQSGYEEGYVETLKLTWADREGGHSPLGGAIRAGQVRVARNIPTDLRFAAFQERALQRGFAASIGLPLKVEGQVLGALSICATEPDAFDDREVELLVQLANDLTYGVEALRNRAELDRRRNRLEEILRERNEAYGMVLRTAMDGFWMADTRGRLLEVNDSYCRLIGYSRDELLARSIGDVEVAESAQQIADHIRAVMRSGSDRFVTRHRRKDGTVLDVEVSAGFLPLHGGRLFVFIRDVTERKRMEEALKASRRWVE